MLSVNDISSLDRERKDFLRKLSSHPVVIYGAASGADHVIKYLRSYGIDPVACAVDPAYLPAKRIKSYHEGDTTIEYPIYSNGEVSDHYSEFITAQACSPASGLPNLPGQLFAFLPLRLSGLHSPDYLSEEFVRQNIDLLSRVESLLHDDSSKSLLNAFIKAMISHNLSYLDQFRCFPSYFRPEFLSITDHEFVIDCGAFDGDTLNDFLAVCNRKFSFYHAFEPDPFNFKKLEEMVRLLKDDRIKVYPYGAGERDAVLKFKSSGDWESGISQYGNIEISVHPLDELDIGHPVSFIKMDIEGAELSALKGAAHIIRRDKPKLAICVYHRYDDLLTIPQYIKELVPEYHFKLGYHSFTDCELVLYCH